MALQEKFVQILNVVGSLSASILQEDYLEFLLAMVGKANRDKLTLYTNNRRARKLFAKGSHTDEEWQTLKKKYNFKCLCCGKQEPEIKLTRDHVRPLVLGGSDSKDNIQPLYARCNSKKSLRQIDYR